MRGVSCCRCSDGFGEKMGVEGRDGEDFEVELAVNEVICGGFWVFEVEGFCEEWRPQYVAKKKGVDPRKMNKILLPQTPKNLHKSPHSPPTPPQNPHHLYPPPPFFHQNHQNTYNNLPLTQKISSPAACTTPHAGRKLRRSSTTPSVPEHAHRKSTKPPARALRG